MKTIKYQVADLGKGLIGDRYDTLDEAKTALAEVIKNKQAVLDYEASHGNKPRDASRYFWIIALVAKYQITKLSKGFIGDHYDTLGEAKTALAEVIKNKQAVLDYEAPHGNKPRDASIIFDIERVWDIDNFDIEGVWDTVTRKTPSNDGAP